MKLKALALQDCEQVRQWRNENLNSLRTPFPLTKEMQEQFYNDTICSRNARARYWGVWIEKTTKVGGEVKIQGMYLDAGPERDMEYDVFIGMCGLENISLENRNAEISLMLDPEYPMSEYGEETLRLLLHEGFMNMNLENIYTEVYECNPNMHFWRDVVIKFGSGHYLPQRKFFNNRYWDSLYVNINKGAYIEYEHTVSQPTHTSD